MRHRRRSTAEIIRRDRLAQGLAGVAIAAAALLKVAGAPTWAAISAAAVGLALAATRVGLEIFRSSSEVDESREQMLRVPPIRVGDLADRAGFYELGVETEALQALRALGSHDKHADYVRRDIDEALRRRLQRAVEVGGVSLIVVSGPPTAGKSRTLAEGLVATVPDAWLLAPRGRKGVDELARGRQPSPIDSLSPCVVWLDDMEPFVGDPGLRAETLRLFARWGCSVVVVATHGGKGIKLAAGREFAHDTHELLRRYEPIALLAELSADETDRLAAVFSAEVAARARALGEFLIVAPALMERYHTSTECLEGVAVARAAVDWRRAGLIRPTPADALEALYVHYVSGPTDHERFERGLRWAATPLYAHVALLQGTTEYAPYDYVADSDQRPIKPETLTAILEQFASAQELGAPVGLAALGAGDVDRAELAFRVGDDRGDPVGSFNLGVLLARERDDLAGAEAAYRRADARGHDDGPSNLGALLERRGELDAAEVAYRRADERGSAAGAYNLGVLLLRERDDREGAEAAFRRADERGDDNAAYNLGVLLEQRGENDAAEAAYRRADDRRNADAATNLGVLLQRRGDSDGAEAAFWRADHRGDGAGASNLGFLLEHERGDPERAEWAYRRADERGDGGGACNLGVLLLKRGDNDAAEAAFRRADERGHPDGAYNIGVLCQRRGDIQGAEAAYRRADERGHASAASNLGVLLRQRGELDAAEAAYRRADDRGDGAGASNLGSVLRQRGELDAAEAAYRRAANRGHPEGTYNLGLALKQRGDVEGAEIAWKRVTASDNPKVADAARRALAKLHRR